MGAHYTNAKRTESVLSKAKAAYQALILDNKKPTQKAVQELSGLGIATIKDIGNQLNRWLNGST
ncbi:hypothetical protein ACX13_01610 [Vibrio parahaemolyticus]|nr:hypothetical protein ACX13_01610 [Vibrio parahaemolyticus]